MSNRAFKRVTACITAFFLLFGMTLSVNANTAEIPDYAEIVFGENLKLTNMSIKGPFDFKGTEKGGRPATVISGTASMYLDVSDKFMPEVPDHTPIDITVEYFDEGNGYFNLVFGSHHPPEDLTRAINVGYTPFIDLTEAVFLQNTGEWKSYTFRVNDLKANAYNYSSDIRLGFWIPFLDATSPESVAFGSLKVKYADDPIHDTISSDYVGNVFSLNEDIVMHINGFNTEETAVDAEYTYKVKNSDGEIIHEGKCSAEFAPQTEQTEKITIPNPGRYDLYTIEFDVKYKFDGKEFSETIKNGFSVAMVYENGDMNTELGQMQHIGNKHRGNPENVGRIIERSGLSFLRDDTPGTTYQSGEYILDADDVDRWKRYKAAGGGEIMSILVVGSQLARGLAHNDLPDEPEEYQAYAEFCADVVTQLKGITNYFELWNEPNITFGNKNLAPAEGYAEMCKAAIPAIRKANPDAVILIGCTAATGSNESWMDEDFHKRIFEAGALEGADGVSVHPYDWSGTFREQRFLKGCRDLRAMMDEYGAKEKEIWITEYGFSSNTGGGGGHGYTREQSARNFVMSYNIMKSYDVIDFCMYYALSDRVLPLDVENNWGWLTALSDIPWRGEGSYSSAAKESYLAMMAAGHFFGDDAEVKSHKSYYDA